MQTMWTEAVDLHSHSTHSDGAHNVNEVADKMAERGVKVWALTDHDTASGWPEAWEAARSRRLRFIPGMEITCRVEHPASTEELARHEQERPSASWHLLAYFPRHVVGQPDEAVTAFLDWLAPHREGREPRMRAMCQRLTDLGMPVDAEAVIARASGSVGRPHLAATMVELGYVSNKQEAFEQWIGDGLPAFVPHALPTLSETVAQVKAAGGITSLAHPRYYGVPSSELMDLLKTAGVDAVEAVHRSHSDAYRHELMEHAQSAGLAVSVGSDFHGDGYGHAPGRMPVNLTALLSVFHP